MKKVFWILLTGIILLSARPVGDRRERSPHFKDGIFHNTKKYKTKTVWDSIRNGLKMDWQRWPHWMSLREGKKPGERIGGSEIVVTFINHSTFLIQTGGYNILTDPVYSVWCGPIPFTGTRRVHKPAIAFKNLPKIDVVIVSHDHYDHLDTGIIEDLVERDNPRIYVGLGVADYLDSQANVMELDWWESVRVDKGFQLSFAETQHSSGRIPFSKRFSTLWGAFVLNIHGRKIYFGGDSGYADHYKKTFQKFGPMDLALLPIGGYAPRYAMKNNHMDPAQAVRAHRDLGSKQSIGMHYGTFQLTAEPWDEPPHLLEAEKKKASIPPEEFITLELGASFLLP